MVDKTKMYSYDSRLIQKGSTFLCLPKGDQHIKDALDRGADDVIHLTRREFAEFSNEYFDYASENVA